MSDEMVADYFQLGEPTDSFVPGDDKQRIDLDEYYKTTEQDNATVMVQGAEELSIGKFSKRTATLLGLKGTKDYDPFPSARNARLGSEGFFSTVIDGFKAFVKAAVKYIRMAINWVVDSTKTFFGFRKSDRIIKEINNSLDDLKKEFAGIITGLGLDPTYYDIDRLIGDLPPGIDRVPQLTLLKNKFVSEEDAMVGLSNSLPLFQKCVSKLNQASDKVVRASGGLKRTIQEEYRRVRVRKHMGDSGTAEDSPEVNRILKACLDVEQCLDTKQLSSEVQSLYEVLYGIEFGNDELADGFDRIRKTLHGTIIAETDKVTTKNVSDLMVRVTELNSRYIDIKDDEIDLRRVDWKTIGGIIDDTDADCVNMISLHFNYPQLMTEYQKLVVDVRNFTNFCFLISQALLKVETQINNLVKWRARVVAYLCHGLLDEIEECRKINLEARKEGFTPLADARGYPTKMVLIQEADAKTLMEHFSELSKQFIDEDLGGVKTIYNNFVKQLGWGKPL